MARETLLESPPRADPEGPPGSPTTAGPSALDDAVRTASPTARQASLAWRLSLLPARGATETVPEAETSEDARPFREARLDVDEKRLRRAKTDADALLRDATTNAASVAFERAEPPLESRVFSSRRTFVSVEPSRAVTAYKTDAAIASWMEKRKQKEQGRTLLRVRRARRDLDWILARRKAQIAVCRREVKHDRADRALQAKTKREELEKLAVAPPADRRETRAETPPRLAASPKSPESPTPARRARAASRENDAPRDSETDDRIRREASVGSGPAPAGAHRRGSRTRDVSRRGGARDAGLLAAPFRRRTLFGYAVRARDGEDEARGRADARESEDAPRRARTSSPERSAVRVETKSVWVGPGRFVSMRVEMPPVALAARARRRSSSWETRRTSPRARDAKARDD